MAKLLNLDTLTDRPTVIVDGVAYPLRAVDGFSILEFKRHMKAAPRIGELLDREDLTEDEGAELSRLLDASARRVLAAPADVHDKLNDMQRLQVYSVFLSLPGSHRPTVTMPGAAPTTLDETIPPTTTGATPSPDSLGSMAATH